jgi:hypothetical protein
VPFLFKEAVDVLNATTENVALVPIAILLACTRSMTHSARVAQRRWMFAVMRALTHERVWCVCGVECVQMEQHAWELRASPS